MKLKSVLTLGAIAFTAACAVDTPTAPNAVQKQLSAQGNSNKHIVAFTSAAIPADFAAAVEAAGGRVESSLDAIGGAVVSGLSESAVASLAARSDVIDVEPEQLVPFRDRTTAAVEVGTDALVNSQTAPQSAIVFARQWNMRAVNAPAAWAQGRLGSSTTVAAILDTGIDPTLPDLNGLVDLAHSKSFVPEDDALLHAVFPTAHVISDLDGHGTNVATQVSSKAQYFAGVTSRTTLLGVKVCSLVLDGCPFGAILSGIEYAVDQGASVINMSLGGSFAKRGNGAFNALLNRVFQYAEQNGTTVVVSAGNAGADMDHAPNVHWDFCDQTHVICVSATGANNAGPSATGPFNNVDAFASYSNYGKSRVDVAAPGGDFVLNATGTAVVTAAWVWSLCPRTSLIIQNNTVFYTNCSYPPNVAAGALFANGYAGTSQASPHVTGLAALLASEVGKNPVLIRNKINKGADALGKGGNDEKYGAGRINVGNTR